MTQVKSKEPLLRIAKRDTISRPKAWAIRIVAVLLSLVVSGVFIFAVTRMNPLDVYQGIFDGAFGTSIRTWNTIRDAMMLLNLSDTAAYLRLHRLTERQELEQVGKKYYIPGTVVPEEKQWEVVSAYLREAGFAYCQDIAELLHVSKRKTAGVLRRMVKDGRLLQFDKRYYLAKQPEQKQVQ